MADSPTIAPASELTPKTNLNQVNSGSWSKWTCADGVGSEFNSSFLQHASGKGIAGACVWAAIFITCHQIYQYLR